MATGNVRTGVGRYGPVLRPSRRMREDLRCSMIYLTGVVAALVFAYLLTAMIRPEWF
ncbi:MAG: potassium-transporting ATPase subunit F [Acidobacteria bacterium]|nr:potassium-transporting ATPase subunit F [Acidobacteriota bacterium]